MSLILGLWSVVLEPGKTYSQTTTPAIQITNISFGAEVTGSARSVVTLKYPEFEQDSDDEEESDDESDEPIKLPKLITKEAVIAILKPDVTEQVCVNINLVEDVDIVEFSVSGPNAVHLVGHYVRQEDFDQDPYSDSDDEGGEFDSDDESIDSDMMGDESMEGLSGMIGDESADEDPARFAEIKEIIKDAKKTAATNPKKRAAEDQDVAASLLKGDDDADASMSSTLSKNQKKKLAKKLKGPDGAAAAAPAAEEKKVEKKDKASPEKKENKVEPSPAKKEGPKPVTLAGGLIILDSKKGDGAVAKSGKKVGMRYIGKLDNGKIFDSNTKGSPLVFTLGRGEVIKGWDQGVAGMAVGGERKLTIPAALAYGKKGTQGIPGNATLHFDVKLVTLK